MKDSKHPLPQLYIKNGCPWCHDAVAWLDARQIAYNAIDVRTDQAAYETMVAISGQTKSPTLQLPDGRVLADFDVDQLPGFLKKN